MPSTGLQKNTLVLLGEFLYSYQFQLLRLIPFISRLSDLLQREAHITQLQDRIQTQALSVEIGKAMNEIVLATVPVVDFFRNLQLGERPGEFRLPQLNQTNASNPNQQGSQMHMNLGQPTNSNSNEFCVRIW